MKLVTVDSVVRSAIMSKRYTIHHYGMFLHYALDFLREANFDVLGQIKTCTFYMNGCNYIDIPKDWIDYNKIGIERDGKVQTIGVNPALSRMKSHYHSTSTDDSVIYINGDSFGTLSSKVFNVHPNSFKVVPEKNRIQFDGDMTNEKVYIEYLAAGGDLHGLSVFHPYAQKSMEEYIIWKHKENSRSVANYDRERARREFYNARRVLLQRKSDLSLQAILRILRQNSHQGIKN